MESTEVVALVSGTLWVTVKVGAPVLLVALGVGLVISVMQALTQIQEATLSFVPKIVAVGFSLMLALPFMFTVLRAFTEDLFGKIVAFGGS
jgi:flagellar biosynthetic protein FliQ